MRSALLFYVLILAVGTALAQDKPKIEQDQLPPSYMPTGKQMFKEYCAACHGLDAKGHGPARVALKVPAADLTTLAKRHNGEFPSEYVSDVLMFGPDIPAHGSSNMPTWGQIFLYRDSYNQKVVQKRIKNLCDYLASLQEK